MTGEPKSKLRSWKSISQFIAAAAVVLALGVAVDPIAEHFRRGRSQQGWKRFRPPHETAALLVEGSRLWAGGRDGLSLFDWAKGELIPLPKGTPQVERVRTLMLDSSGALWVGHGSGIERRIGEAWSHLDSCVGAVEAILQRQDGEIWAGGEKGLARFDGVQFRVVRDSAALGFEGVHALIDDRIGDLWVSSASPVHGGLTRLGRTGVWEDFTHAPGLAHPSVAAIFEDRDGALWFASGFGKRGGACKLSNGQWNCLGKKDGLTADRTRLIFQDHTGRFWISSETEGLAVQNGSGWRILTPDQGMTGWEVKRIVEAPDGVFWLGTEDGVTSIRADAAQLRGGAVR